MCLHESLFERLVRLKLPRAILSIQYRMHPSIASFPSVAFYGGLLKSGVKPEQRLAPRGYPWPKTWMPLCFESIGADDGWDLEETQGTSKMNKKEAQRTAEVVMNLLRAGDVPASEIAVISPYSAQTTFLKNQFGPAAADVQVSTVDSYQGMERDVVIVTTVRSSSYGSVGFLNDRRRFNVLLTRARRGLIVLGNQKTLMNDPCWRHWILHVSHHGLYAGEAWKVQGQAEMDGGDVELEADWIKENNSGPGQWMDFTYRWKSVENEVDTNLPTVHNANFADAASSNTGLPLANPIGQVHTGIPVAQDSSAMPSIHPKNKLMESGLFPKGLPVQMSESGPLASRTFIASMTLPAVAGGGVVQGKARTKKEAERECCEQALYILGPFMPLAGIGGKKRKKALP